MSESADTTIDLNEIYDKNINFLLGSGASFGLYPTLELKIKDTNGQHQTIETLSTLFEPEKLTSSKYNALFMHYYKTCIDPILKSNFKAVEIFAYAENEGIQSPQSKVLENYGTFVTTLIHLIQHRKAFNRHCNVFTTNYDGCLPYVTDKILADGKYDFVINDGTRGFFSKHLMAKNFNSYVCETGIFERHRTDIPQINLINLHGSAYWYKSEDSILVDYSTDKAVSRVIDLDILDSLSTFSNTLMDASKTIAQLPEISISESDIQDFWREYNSLPIVNPTKWKFHETLFEEHYYQMLRLMSYELEKPNSILITFGFSFADEHIRNIIRRSLSNPTLQVFICCYNEQEKQRISHYFRQYKNVRYIYNDDNLDFTVFNNLVFSTAPAISSSEH